MIIDKAYVSSLELDKIEKHTFVSLNYLLEKSGWKKSKVLCSQKYHDIFLIVMYDRRWKCSKEIVDKIDYNKFYVMKKN